jgi:prepilin-type N-terminal cleavage/methylation domain-containing protein
MKNNFIHRGFTLVEVLIYIVLFGLLMTGAVTAAYQLLQSGQQQDISFAAQQEGTFINRKLAWALGPATNVSVAGGNVMTITRPDLGSESPLVIDASGAQMMLARGTAAPQFLNTPGLTLENVLFEVTPASGGLPKSVRVVFTLGKKPFSYAMYLRQ